MPNAQPNADLSPGQTPHTVRQTAAGAITVPASTPYLAHITIKGHATEPTVLGILYDGVNRALFGCQADSWAEFDVSWPVGTSIPATWLTVISDDTPQAWTLTFDKAGYGPSLEAFTGVFFEAEVADSGTPITVTYPGGESVPVAVWGGQTTGVAAANARIAFPAIGDVQQIVEFPDGAAAGGNAFVIKQAAAIPKATSVQITPTIVGALTYLAGILYYQRV